MIVVLLMLFFGAVGWHRTVVEAAREVVSAEPIR